MILKTIACEGKVLEPWMLMDEIDVVDLESGIKKSGTFHFICRECDALYFQDYENKEALLNDPTDKMLAEIALKSMLQMLSKRNEEIALFDIFQKMISEQFYSFFPQLSNLIYIQKILYHIWIVLDNFEQLEQIRHI